MKNLLFFFVANVLVTYAIAQPTITPSINNEYCPTVEYTFTVTITKSYSSMIGVSGCYVTQLPSSPVGTTFTFKGKFNDVNQKQTFRIFHPDNTTTDFNFKKIKSLFYGTSCTPIQPNVSLINAPRCQASNFTISFNKISWSTSFESPALCFGEIATYEYLLPANWSLGTNVSNGSSWISAGNNVTITSDLSNGVNGNVSIRPLNDCASGLQKGESQVVQIPISRPAPTLSISASSGNVICSGSKDFTILGMPAGSTVIWSISDPTIASIPANSTSSTVTVSKLVTGSVYLKATVTHCTFTYEAGGIVVLGTPSPYEGGSFNDGGSGNQPLGNTYNAVYNNTVYVTLQPLSSSGTEFSWEETSKSGDVSWYYPTGNYAGIVVYFSSPNYGNQIGFTITRTNDCGIVSEPLVFQYSGGYYYRIAPNPVNNSFNITKTTVNNTNSLDKKLENEMDLIKIQILDKMGNLLMQINPTESQRTNVNTTMLKPDVYTVRLITKSKVESHKIVVQH